VLAVAAGGVTLAVLAAALGAFAPPQLWRWAVVPACFGGVLLAEKFPVKIDPSQKVNLTTLPCLVAALLLPTGVGPATACLSILFGTWIVRRRWPESVFNASTTLVAASLAAMIGAAGRDVDVAQDLRATAAGLVYIVVNLAIAILASAWLADRSFWSELRQKAGITWPASLTLAACGVSIALLALEAPLAAPLPLIVLPLIYRMNLAIEAQAAANEQLAGVLAAQRRFLTDVSHQVATPLATIMTNLVILSRATRGDTAREAVMDSVAEAERMKRMLGRLRSLAHADEDVPLRRELVDLAELTADIVHAFTAQAGTSGVGLFTEVKAHPRVKADKDLLREAVANLVDNALRVSPRGARVKLEVERGSAGPTIAVVDSGPGIEEERLSHLFDRFQRSEAGSGLGLAIARRVVERHGGTLRVQTKRGAGSTFTIELPG
jgi:signal transduction histidine kinase